jgi:hypothetical protein
MMYARAVRLARGMSCLGVALWVEMAASGFEAVSLYGRAPST